MPKECGELGGVSTFCWRTLHEPPLSRPSATLSPPGGERAGRGVPIWFMVPMHAQKRMKASHEPPPHPFPLPIRWGEGGRRSGEGRFMVPMHAKKRKGASPEPRSRRRESAHLFAFEAKDSRRLTSAATVHGKPRPTEL